MKKRDLEKIFHFHFSFSTIASHFCEIKLCQKKTSIFNILILNIALLIYIVTWVYLKKKKKN